MSKIRLPETKTLRLEQQGSCLRVWLDRAESRNALSDEMIDEFTAVLDATRDNRDVRSIVVRGKHGFFCAGGDIKGFRNVLQGGMAPAQVAAANRRIGEFLQKLNEQPQVVIMLVEGAAIGGGLGLSCVGDVTIVTADTRFRLSETSLGIPPAQIAPFVVERIGLTQARSLMLTGAKFDGREALRIGLAHSVAKDGDDLEAQCEAILGQIRHCGPQANATTKSILFASAQLAREQAMDFAASGFADCMLGDEGREGIAAFIEKRKTRWSEEP